MSVCNENENEDRVQGTSNAKHPTYGQVALAFILILTLIYLTGLTVEGINARLDRLEAAAALYLPMSGMKVQATLLILLSVSRPLATI